MRLIVSILNSAIIHVFPSYILKFNLIQINLTKFNHEYYVKIL